MSVTKFLSSIAALLLLGHFSLRNYLLKSLGVKDHDVWTYFQWSVYHHHHHINMEREKSKLNKYYWAGNLGDEYIDISLVTVMGLKIFKRGN